MKLGTTTVPTLDFVALREVKNAHDAGYKAKQLARRRAHYTFLFQRYQDLLTLDDEGYEVSITLKSATKTVILSASESEGSFDLTALYQKHGKHMGALQAEILDLLTEVEDDTAGTFAGTDAAILHQVVALCMLQTDPVEAQAHQTTAIATAA